MRSPIHIQKEHFLQNLKRKLGQISWYSQFRRYQWHISLYQKANLSSKNYKINRAIDKILLIYKPLFIAPLILSLPEDKIRVKICYITIMHNWDRTFIHGAPQLHNSFGTPTTVNFTCSVEFPPFPTQVLILGVQAFTKMRNSTCMETKFCIIHFSQIEFFI